MPSLADAVRELGLPPLRGAEVVLKREPARPARFTEPERALPPPLTRYLDRRGLSLFSHQSAALDALARGEDVLLSTGTASGKSLVYGLHAARLRLADAGARALMLFPAKALTNDQFLGLKELERGTGVGLSPATYDGDTPRSKRPAIRREAGVVLSNPYELHEVLAGHVRWRPFLSSCRLVVLDECHRYRGVFGTNVAYLLRRLARVLTRYGSRPQFVLSSATVVGGAEHAEALIGRGGVRVVDEDGSAQGKRVTVLWNPPFEDESRLRRRAPWLCTPEVVASLAASGKRSLVFVNSRRSAELTALSCAKRLGKRGRVAAYRAGYLPEERRRLEESTKRGELSALVTTNALELGIDVGALDAVILVTYPGSVAATRQRAGRAGRGGKDAVIVLVVGDNPLEQYVFNHPECLLGAPVESAVLGLRNRRILAGQVVVAASELPIVPERDEAYFGEGLREVLGALVSAGLLRETPSGFVYAGTARASTLVSLDTTFGDGGVVVSDGRLLEKTDRLTAYREVHKGAVFIHQGDTYVCESFDVDDLVARVERRDVDYLTRPVEEKSIEVTRTVKRAGRRRLAFGEGRVTVRYRKFVREMGGEVVGTSPLSLPPLSFDTEALWFGVPDDVEETVGETGADFFGGLHALEHAAIAIAPLIAGCDRHDVGGISLPAHEALDGPGIFIYDGVAGGVGIAERLFTRFDELMRMTLELLTECPCEQGCPSCIYSPRCGNDNEPLDKSAARAVARAICRR